MKVILRNKTCECHKLALATDIKSRGLSVEGTRVTLTSSKTVSLQKYLAALFFSVDEIAKFFP